MNEATATRPEAGTPPGADALDGAYGVVTGARFIDGNRRHLDGSRPDDRGDDPGRAPRDRRLGSRLPYNPALDGLRGVAVAVVLLFHGGYSWARGGYLGVSTFFTLSGFLITSLLVAEHRDTGRVRLSAFWARRLRRLFPASALTLAGLSLSALLVEESWESDLQGDVLGALFQVANWRFIFEERSYGDLFAAPSPVTHFWSLAIEEQFYWAFPLLAAGVFALFRGSRAALATVLAGLLAASVAVTLVVGPDDRTFAYYATPTRMGEILVGCLLALALRRGLPGGGIVARLAAVAGVVALAASAFAWWNLGQDSPRLYQGGLLAYALVSGVLVLSATVPGPVRAVLAVAPLRLLGVVSYGVYLYHWPVFLLLDRERTGLAGERLFALRVAATLAVATVSYAALERPIRRGWRPSGGPAPRLVVPALGAGAFAAVVVAAAVVPRVSEPPEDPFVIDAAWTQYEADPDPATLPSGALVGLTIGDSTANVTSYGLLQYGRETEMFTLRGGPGGLGCGITRGGDYRFQGEVGEVRDQCDAWQELILDAIEVRRERYGHVDFALVQYGPWDVSDRRLEGSDRWSSVGDPAYDEYLRSEIAAMVDTLLDQGVYVVWARAPYIDVGRAEQPPPAEPYPESDPARMDRFNQIAEAVIDEREGAVMLDLQGLLRRLPGGELDATYVYPEDGSVRPYRADGLHLDAWSAQLVAYRGLGAELLRVLQAEVVPPGSDWAAQAGQRTLQPDSGPGAPPAPVLPPLEGPALPGPTTTTTTTPTTTTGRAASPP